LHIEVLPGIGHWPSLEAPEAVNQLIQNFIASEDYPIASLEL
jgi:pimeloyl-ACP methyl ester carboxylesterase